MSANLTSVGIAPVYPSRSLGEGRASPRRLNSDTAAADVGESNPCPLTRLHRAIGELFNAVSNALQDELDSAQECVQRARDILQLDPPLSTHLPASPPTQDASRTPIRGGLAPWQIRRVITHIEAHLDSTIRTTHLAVLVRLSSFHFCRAFRESFGDSPHGYLMRRRVERAQGLMLTTTAPLGQIAAECGLADQAHFNKLFRRFVGDSPGAWRRARACGAVSLQAGSHSRPKKEPQRRPTQINTPTEHGTDTVQFTSISE
jgi:AraC-like DNA-binding protein